MLMPGMASAASKCVSNFPLAGQRQSIPPTRRLLAGATGAVFSGSGFGAATGAFPATATTVDAATAGAAGAVPATEAVVVLLDVGVVGDTVLKTGVGSLEADFDDVTV